MRFLAMLMVTVASAGCASSSQSAAPAAQATAVAAAATTTSPAPASAPSKAEVAAAPDAADSAAANDSFHPPAGYRAVKRGDETVYCTSTKPIGSNLTKTACYTQAQLEEIERRAQGIRQDLQQGQKGCASTGGGCGGT